MSEPRPVWGLLGPERLSRQRRLRTFQVGSAVRHFNNLAVPGTGGIWFAKQLLLACFGVALAEEARKHGRRLSGIAVANAVEALACWIAFDQSHWGRDPRLLGRQKMPEQADLSFEKVRQPSFYVTQPMRMKAVQPLRDLGLVEGVTGRFNSFTCTEQGRAFIKEGFAEHGHDQLTKRLLGWIKGDAGRIDIVSSCIALSPLRRLPAPACDFLIDVMVAGPSGEATRRRNALDWVEHRRGRPTEGSGWSNRPPNIEESHWRDLKLGGFFFLTIGAATAVLDDIEAELSLRTSRRFAVTEIIPESVERRIDELRQKAARFLDDGWDPSPGRIATAFCEECRATSNSAILCSLVSRDDSGLKLLAETILPGPAFRGHAREEDTADAQDEGEPSRPEMEWPEGISPRISNLFMLNADLKGDLERLLNGHGEPDA